MEEKYPTARVIIQYGFFGSLIGTFIGCIIATVLTLGVALLFIPGMLPASVAVGFAPAVTTGIILALRKESIKDGQGSSWIMLIGFLTTVIYVCIYFLFENLTSPVQHFAVKDIGMIVFWSIIAGLLGGLTSVYTGKMVLPKINSNKENVQ